MPTIILVLLAIFTTAFAFINYSNTVKVWPLVGYQPLTLVIAVAFVLGACVGGLLGHVLRHGRTIAAGISDPQNPDYREPARKL